MTSLRSRFPRISDYGFLSDCHRGALVSPEGSIEWLCLPRFDSPSVFGSLLDRSGGFWRVGPPSLEAPVSRRYEPGTNVLETTWMTGSGWIVVRDALSVGDWRLGHDFEPHRRPPSDDEAEHVLIRTIECVQGEVDVEMVCQPAFDYGETRVPWERRGDEGTSAELRHGDMHLILTGDLGLGVDGGDARARHRLRAGERCFTALAWGPEPIPPQSAEECAKRLDRTVDFWRRWLETGHFPDHPWRGSLQRSALALKGLTYAPTGATVAALTTSLPETPGGERNWDYRYTWIRDATFTLWSLHTLGFDYEATDFMGYMADIYRANQEHPGMQIMYGIRGERDLEERTLDHLTGYENASPVRIGNAAVKQRQNDVYGALLDSVYIHTKVQDHLPHELWEALCRQVETAIAVWEKPDQGIWEARGEPKHYVSSKLMCWVAVDRGCRLADRIGDAERLARWSQIHEEIRADILERGVRRGVFRQHYDTDALDASTLLVPLVRFLPADDERVRATVLAIADELTVEGLVLRYRIEETDDGLEGLEATFLICSFWLVSALSEIGERDRARELCERLLGHAGPLGLYAEELDPRSGRHWGNYPQAFTHLALINAVAHVISDDRAARDGGPSAVLTEMVSRRG
jgi:GH15 family glucan-1,4-alpha-glucosidase